MTDSIRRIVKSTTIREADRYLQIEPCIVTADMTLYEAGICVSKRPDARVISVVEGAGKLLGLVSTQILIEDVLFAVMPEEFFARVRDFNTAASVSRLATARTVRDVMLPPVSVTMANTVRDAFELMHQHNLAGLPIVDESKVVTGYIDLLELALVLIRSHELHDPKPPKMPEQKPEE